MKMSQKRAGEEKDDKWGEKGEQSDTRLYSEKHQMQHEI